MSGNGAEDGRGSAVADARLLGRRVLVVGASSGVGRATGLALGAAGAHVAFAARRTDRVEASAAQVGGRSFGVACDVRDEASVEAAVARSLDAFGGLDALVYAPGIAVFEPLKEIDAEVWREVMETNLVGPSLVVRHAIEALDASRGKVVLVSSIVIDDSPPRPWNAPYVVSKSALETLARAWQGEHRRVGFTTVAMGDTVTEFGQQGDLSRLAPMVKAWIRDGYMYGRAMDPEAVVEPILTALVSRETIRRIAITPHYADGDEANDGFW